MKRHIKGNSIRLRLKFSQVTPKRALENQIDFDPKRLVCAESPERVRFASRSALMTTGELGNLAEVAVAHWGAKRGRGGVLRRSADSENEPLMIAVKVNLLCLNRNRADSNEAAAYSDPLVK